MYVKVSKNNRLKVELLGLQNPVNDSVLGKVAFSRISREKVD